MFISFMEEVVPNRYCWPETLPVEAVRQEQVLLKGFPGDKNNAITFPNSDEIHKLFMPGHQKRVAAKRRMMVGA